MKNTRALLLLFTANAISGFAQGMSMLAVPWYFAAKTQSQVFTFSYGIITLGVMFFGLYAGTLVDRFSRKSNFLVTNLICGTIILSIGALGAWQQHLPNLLVIAVFGLTMFNYNIHYPTLYAFAHEISTEDAYQKVNSWIEIAGQSTSILSGALAAILLDGTTTPFLIKPWQVWDIFLLDGSTYFLAATLIYFIRYIPAKQVNVQLGSIWVRLKTGFSYLKQHPSLLVFGFFSNAVFATVIVGIHSLLPVYVKQHLHASGAQFATADLIYAIGALLAGFIAGKVFKPTQTLFAIAWLSFVGAGIYMWLFLAQAVWVLYAFCVLLGFSNAGIRVLRLTYFFKYIPNEVMGRVNSIFNMLNVLNRSLFIFLFSIPFFNFESNVVWACFILSIFLGVSGLILLKHARKFKQHSV